jgi:hypothetical protein
MKGSKQENEKARVERKRVTEIENGEGGTEKAVGIGKEMTQGG